MTIHEIKAKVEAAGSNYFTRETMKFFNPNTNKLESI